MALVAGPENLVPALASQGVLPALSFENGGETLRHARRDLSDGGTIFFLRNTAPAAVHIAVRPEATCGDGRWLHPWTGTAASVVADKQGLLQLDLAAYGSTFLLCGAGAFPCSPPLGASPPQTSKLAASSFPLEQWTLSVEGPDVGDGSFSVRTFRSLRLARTGGPALLLQSGNLPGRGRPPGCRQHDAGRAHHRVDPRRGPGPHQRGICGFPPGTPVQPHCDTPPGGREKQYRNYRIFGFAKPLRRLRPQRRS